MKCMECESNASSYDDPRTPPLELGKCLCEDCHFDAVSSEIYHKLQEIDDLTNAVSIERRSELPNVTATD